MAAKGQIDAAKIEDHWPAKQFRQQRSLQQLPAGPAAFAIRRAVPQGLAVTAHQLGAALRIAGPGRHGLVLGEVFGQGEQGVGVQGHPLADGHQALAQVRGVGGVGAGENPPAGPGRTTGQAHQHRVHPVGAGAAHQAQHPHGCPSQGNQWEGRASRASLLPITTSSSEALSTWEAGGLTVSWLEGPAASTLTL